MWIARAISEVRQAPVTWLFTGTFAADPPGEEAVKREAVRFWKRLRKGLQEPVNTYRGPVAVPGVRVRFLQVVEHGEKNGRLHLHALVHGNGSVVRWLQLRTAWHAGHMHARRVAHRSDGELPDDVFNQIRYVAGYLAKQQGRVIASLRYGRRTHPTDSGPHKDGVAQASASACCLETGSARNDAPHATTMAQPAKQADGRGNGAKSEPLAKLSVAVAVGDSSSAAFGAVA